MGTLSGCRSYYALEDFGVRHYQTLSEKLGLTVNRLPSDTTFRCILQRKRTLSRWVQKYALLSGSARCRPHLKPTSDS